MGRWLTTTLRITITTLVLLELVLQAGSVWIWWSHEPDQPDTTSDDRVVLCVGDSFTYGMGAATADGAYPAQLERMLRAEHGPAWRVVNGGYPGRDSREMLERLDAQIARTDPEFVCILAGNNDLWSRPELLVLPPAEASRPPVHSARPGFRFEWRTLRMIAWLSGKFRAGQPTMALAAENAEPGDDAPSHIEDTVWRGGGFELHFEPKGQLQFASPASTSLQPGAWRAEGERVRLLGLAIHCKRVGEQLWLSHPDMPDFVVLERDDSSGDSGATSNTAPPARTNTLGAAWSAIGDQDFARAKQSLLLGLRELEAQDTPLTRAVSSYRFALVYACTGLGERDEAQRHLEWLERAMEREPDASIASDLLSALSKMGSGDRCVELGAQFTQRYPDAPRLWQTFAWEAFQAGDRRTAIDAARRSLELTPTSKPRASASRYRALAQFLRDDGDARGAAEAVVRSYLADADPVRFRQTVAWVRKVTDVALFDEVLADLMSDPSQRAQARSIVADGLDLDRAITSTDVFESHMRQMIARSKAAGAHPILVSYPSIRPVFHPVVRKLADEGETFVGLHAEFRERLRTTPRSELFATDGHCTDGGYRVIAEHVARAIRTSLDAR